MAEEQALLHGRKVIVTGPMGAGKTTFSGTFARVSSLPHVEVDALSHASPGSSPEAVQWFRDSVRAAIDSHPGGWILDGNHDRVMDIVCESADTLIWLQMPFRIAYPRVLMRTFRRLVTREVLWGSHRDEWRTLLRWYSPPGLGVILWRGHHRKTRGRILRAKPGLQVVILRNPRQVARFLAAATEAARPNPD